MLISHHRVDRVLVFFSSRPNWDSNNPYLQTSVFPSPLVQGSTHSLAGEGVGGVLIDEGTDTVVL